MRLDLQTWLYSLVPPRLKLYTTISNDDVTTRMCVMALTFRKGEDFGCLHLPSEAVHDEGLVLAAVVPQRVGGAKGAW